MSITVGVVGMGRHKALFASGAVNFGLNAKGKGGGASVDAIDGYKNDPLYWSKYPLRPKIRQAFCLRNKRVKKAATNIIFN